MRTISDKAIFTIGTVDTIGWGNLVLATLLLIIFCVISGYIGYLFPHPNTVPTSTTNASPTPTQSSIYPGWSVFSDANYAISFHYPPTWKVQEVPNTTTPQDTDIQVENDQGMNAFVLSLNYGHPMGCAQSIKATYETISIGGMDAKFSKPCQGGYLPMLITSNNSKLYVLQDFLGQSWESTTIQILASMQGVKAIQQGK